MAIDPGVKGGPRVERLVKTGQSLVDQLGKRPGEIDDHQVADQAEGWLAVGAHERAPTVISRQPWLPSGGGQGGGGRIPHKMGDHWLRYPTVGRTCTCTRSSAMGSCRRPRWSGPTPMPALP